MGSQICSFIKVIADFPRVTLVGIISAYTALNIPDFRSSERTFQLLTQVAGRAGRRKLKGQVVIQTYNPKHYAIQAAKKHDYQSFYAQEIAIRKQVALPPFTRLAILILRSLSEEKALTTAEQFAKKLQAALETFPDSLRESIEILGPVPDAIPKLRKQFRFQIVIKAKKIDQLQALIGKALEKKRLPKGCTLAIDIDPL